MSRMIGRTPRFPRLVLIGAVVAACGTESDATDRPEEATTPRPAAVIVAPAEDASLPAPDVVIRLAAEHITLAPAGTREPNTGHLHLFINRDLTPEGEPVPQGEGIVHLGKAQTEYVMDGLEAGSYTVIAALGDWAHVRLTGAVTDTVRFTVN